jgi:hypothetical protein
MRAPALRFALAGAALFAVFHRSLATPPATSAGGATVTAASADASDDALLFEVALTAGLDHTDRLVRARLVNLGRYLSLAPEGADDAAFEAGARDLNLVRSDPIIRRHLIDLMHLTANTLPPSVLPSDAELRAYYGAHRETYTLPARVRFTHVYLSRDRRGTHLADDAAAMAARLQGANAGAGAALGDGFARGAEIGPASETELSRIFGPAFATAAIALPPHQWSAPIASSYGLHIVWIEERLDPAPQPFADVRGQLLHAWLREHRAEQLAASLSALRGG